MDTPSVGFADSSLTEGDEFFNHITDVIILYFLTLHKVFFMFCREIMKRMSNLLANMCEKRYNK